MREAGKGHIINISSVAAVAHIPFQTFYSASKAAISSYSCALDNDVKPYGIQVSAVELGDIHTDFTQARLKVIVGDKEYGGRISRSVSQMEKDEQNGVNPEVIGAYIAKIAEKKCMRPDRRGCRKGNCNFKSTAFGQRVIAGERIWKIIAGRLRRLASRKT